MEFPSGSAEGKRLGRDVKKLAVGQRKGKQEEVWRDLVGNRKLGLKYG